MYLNSEIDQVHWHIDALDRVGLDVVVETPINVNHSREGDRDIAKRSAERSSISLERLSDVGGSRSLNTLLL